MHWSNVRRAARMMVTLAAAAATMGVATGCGDDDDEKKSAKPNSFAVEATAQGKNKKLTFPATVKAGLVTMIVTNSDTKPRSAQFVRIDGDYGVEDVLKVVDSEEEGSPIPAFLQDGGGTGDVAPGQSATATQNLTPGKYAIWDDADSGDGPSNSKLGAKGEFTVTGPAKDDELPSVPATLTATDKGTKDYDFVLKKLKAGTNRVRFENTGKQLHHALFFPISKGSTFSDVEKFFKTDKGRPPIDFEKGVGTSVIDGGIAQNIELDLPAANYALVCFIPDRKGGKPHIAKGMIEEVAIK